MRRELLVALALFVLLPACTRSASTPTPIPNQATIEVQHAAATERALVLTPTQGPTATPFPLQPTNTPLPPMATAPATPTPCSIFADIACDDPDVEAINWVYARGILPACQDEPLRFCPEDGITRGQMFIAEVRALWGPDHIPPYPLGYFWDLWRAKIEDPNNAERSQLLWIAAHVEELWRYHLVAGTSTTEPRSDYLAILPRSQATVFLQRLIYGNTFQPTERCRLFSDVPYAEWYNAWVCSFTQSPFFDIERTGMEGFRPTEHVSKRDLSVWFLTAYNQGILQPPSLPPGYLP